MSESPEIEQIAREWADRAGRDCEYEGDFAADLATDIRGLLASAREEGAKSMQERMWAATMMAMSNETQASQKRVSKAIRALPPSPPPPKEG